MDDASEFSAGFEPKSEIRRLALAFERLADRSKPGFALWYAEGTESDGVG